MDFQLDFVERSGDIERGSQSVFCELEEQLWLFYGSLLAGVVHQVQHCQVLLEQVQLLAEQELHILLDHVIGYLSDFRVAL